MNFRSFCETHQEDIDALWRSTEESVKNYDHDWIKFSVLADALEEDGQDKLSQTLRWMAENKFSPFYYGKWNVFEWIMSKTRVKNSDSKTTDYCWDLPQDIYYKLPNSINTLSVSYGSFKETVEDLSKALV